MGKIETETEQRELLATVYVVDFRTQPRGSFRWGTSRRWYYRVLRVRDRYGSYRINSRNVISI
jgi:hypothetical protein